jgi:hypothetical protein
MSGEATRMKQYPRKRQKPLSGNADKQKEKEQKKT